MKKILPIIPKPTRIEINQDKFNLDDCKIIINCETLMELSENFSIDIQKKFNFNFKTELKSITVENCIFFELNPNQRELGLEGYKILINRQMIKIIGFSRNGIFYGTQTLLQLIYLYGRELPALEIFDKPRFKWRGMHLDVSRHFFGINFIKRYIDLLAFYKINVFHWHLTDDNGWRIEIKKYPELTEICAWRKNLEHIPWRIRQNSSDKGKGKYGGFYTQDEIKEIVEYANQRFITIVPEIEMPGHTSEVFAAFPNFSCKNEKTEVKSGGYWPNTNIFCAGKEETFEFIENILKEVIDLFPWEYIHIGGDEANKSQWKKCRLCQKRILDEKLKDENELQTYFIQRILGYLNKYGKKTIGWDEIIDGGLTKDAIVMCWRGDGKESALKSIYRGNEVVMCPNPILYFDWKQSDNEDEKGAFGVTTIQKVYSYEPLPDSFNENNKTLLLGAQGNVWTEFMNSEKDVEYMILPRMLALSEIVWSEKSQRNWKDFCMRLEKHYKIFDRLGLNYFRNTDN